MVFKNASNTFENFCSRFVDIEDGPVDLELSNLVMISITSVTVTGHNVNLHSISGPR